MNRLSHLNAILLTELTVSQSDTDRLKYLNVILMNKFKDSIEITDVENMMKNENEDLEEVIIQQEKSKSDHDLNHQVVQEMSTVHSLIRGVLIQNCSAGAKNFTKYLSLIHI